MINGLNGDGDSYKKKKDDIADVLETLNHDQQVKLMRWANPRLMWYVDAGIPYSEQQLDEILQFLRELTKR
jgi:hypothetical protein